MSHATHSLALGNSFPYDAPDDWAHLRQDQLAAKDWAHKAARGILADLNDRRGIKHGFVDVDEAVRVEIVESLSDIIRTAFNSQETL